VAIFKKMQFDSAEMEQMYNEYIGSICERNRFFQKFKVQQSLTIARQALEFEKYKDCVGWRYAPKKMRSFCNYQIHFKQFFGCLNQV
jgi:hypothetical protein